MLLLGVGKGKEDVGVLANQTIVVLLLDVSGGSRETHFVKLDLTLAHLIVAEGVLILDLASQFHVLQGGDVEVESLVVDRVEVVLLDGGLLLSKVLVEDHVVLLKLELDVGIGLSHGVLILEVRNLIEVNSQNANFFSVLDGVGRKAMALERKGGGGV